MKIKVLGDKLDPWVPFALEVYDGKFIFLNARHTTGIKFYLRSKEPPRIGISKTNKEMKVMYVPFYINEWKVEID